MADGGGEELDISLSVIDSLSRVDRSAWNAVANPDGAPYDPFVDWDFLQALEASGCVRPATGWTPRHILARTQGGALVGAAPLYLKTHSRGEFVFDHGWADALERAGGAYYPKALCAVPFTPVTGRRLLVSSGRHDDALREALVEGIVGLADEAGLSSAHFNFLQDDDASALARVGLLQRTDQQFQWRNRGYPDFDGFLADLSSRKRKMIRNERARAREGLTIQRLTGGDLKSAHWDAFFRFYQDTGGRKWGSPYLNREFFELLHQRMAERVLLVLAFDDGRPIAGALNLMGSQALYGRYWGRTVNRPFLHFEVCYYQAIEHAILNGFDRVEAGAQGEHKLARGYEPVLTRSAHWIAHPGLRTGVAAYLEQERVYVSQGLDDLAAYTPFRKNGDGQGPDDEETF